MYGISGWTPLPCSPECHHVALLVRRVRPPLPTEDLFVYLYVLVHDLMPARAVVVPGRPGPAPACGDAELRAIVVTRHLLGRRSLSGFLAAVARDWGGSCCRASVRDR